MRRTMIAAAAVLLVALALCVAGTLAVRRATDAAGTLLDAAAAAARTGDVASAVEQLKALEDYWRGRGYRLELLTAHDALSDVQAGIEDARLCLEAGETAEFRRACAALRAALERLRVTEAARLMNLF